MASGKEREREVDVCAEVRAGRVASVYFLYGKERFLAERAVAAIREAVLDPRTRDFNLDVIHCKEEAHAAERIVATARTLPMMARRRLVLVRDADDLDAEDHATLLAYLAAPAPTTCLVLTAEKADLRRRFFLELRKVGVLGRFDPPYERRLPPWIETEARSLGVSLERGVAELLAAVIGADLGQLASSLEQLALFVGGRGRITLADVEEVVAETRQHSVFDLANAVGERDARRALHQCQRMLAAREPAVKILFMLTRHFRQLWTTRELLARRAGREEIAQTLGINPFFVEGLSAQARRFAPRALRRAFDALYAADRALKSSRLGDEMVLERVVLELCRGGATAAP
jgi:DNA polymerase III subunit delta